jgi:hypothetical protein
MIPALDALTGVILLALGVLGWRYARTSAAFALAAAAAWFLAAASPLLVLVHRPLLLHSILAGHRGRVPSSLSGLLLIVAWTGTVMPTEMQPYVSLVTAALCLLTALRLTEPSELPMAGAARSRPKTAPARRALLVLSVGLALPVLERAVGPAYDELDIPLATYMCAISASAAVMLVGLMAAERHEDAVIELANSAPAGALADFRRLAEIVPSSVHTRAWNLAIDLLEDNARLQRELVDRIEEVRASRDRLVDAAVVERQRLERVLSEGAFRYLDELEGLLETAPRHDPEDALTKACLGEIGHTRDDLEQLARGLHPRLLAERGLAAALAELGQHSDVPVEVRAPTKRFSEPVETAMWYACAEAMANVLKHARANKTVVCVTESPGSLCASIQDDGVGGAILAPGGGLAGLVDRLSVVDGSLELTSSPSGTAVMVEVPLR